LINAYKLRSTLRSSPGGDENMAKMIGGYEAARDSSLTKKLGKRGFE